MLFQIKSYLKFLWKSKNEHGVHSPFVFLLLTKCWYDRKPKAEYAILKNFRKDLLETKKKIEVTDFGAGSKVFKTNYRKISAIAKNAGISGKRAELLFRMVRYFQPEKILEIGTSLGLATSAMALGNSKAKIITLEGCHETAKIAKSQFQKFKLENIETVVTKFDVYLNNEIKSGQHFDLIYFDGNHSKNATLHYFESLLSTTTNESLWIFDDIHWSPEMEQAWEIIKKHPKVKVTIDSFRWGLVFFRKEQVKEHFTLRV